MASRDRTLERIRRAQAHHVPSIEQGDAVAKKKAKQPEPAVEIKAAPRQLMCSFCYTPHDQSGPLIAGGIAYMCLLCFDAGARQRPAALGTPRQRSARCVGLGGAVTDRGAAMTTTPPTDTAAALWSAIRYAAGDFIRDGDEQAIDRALTAHVEAEVARRLAAAPEVEKAIETHGDACYERGFRHAHKSEAVDSELDAAYDRLRAAIAADKARAVEAAEDAAFIRGRDAVRKHPEGWGLVARPTPDEARRLVDAFVRAVSPARYDKDTALTARTALLRALGVEA